MTLPAQADGVNALWLATLQRAVGRASHDVRDALNGVSVNLEVVRSRAARPDTPASRVAAFSEAAGQQLERLTTLVEAVLALAREERTPTDVAAVLRRAATLCSASTSAADAAVQVEGDDGSASLTAVAGNAVRLALVAPMLDMASATDAGAVHCTLGAHDDDVRVVLRSNAPRAALAPDVVTALRDAGVRWTEGPMDISLAFPRA